MWGTGRRTEDERRAFSFCLTTTEVARSYHHSNGAGQLQTSVVQRQGQPRGLQPGSVGCFFILESHPFFLLLLQSFLSFISRPSKTLWQSFYSKPFLFEMPSCFSMPSTLHLRIECPMALNVVSFLPLFKWLQFIHPSPTTHILYLSILGLLNPYCCFHILIVNLDKFTATQASSWYNE